MLGKTEMRHMLSVQEKVHTQLQKDVALAHLEMRCDITSILKVDTLGTESSPAVFKTNRVQISNNCE